MKNSFLILNYLWRKSVHRGEIFDLTLGLCKKEYTIMMIWIVFYWLSVLAAYTFTPIWQTNDLRLPINYFIPWLPFEDLDWNWLVNYIFQMVTCTSVAAFGCIYFPLAVLLINHICLQVDTAILLAEKLNKLIVGAPEGRRKCEQKFLLKSIAEMISRTNEWREDVQNLLRLNFLVDFSVLSFLFCLCIFTLSEGILGSFFLLLTMSVFLCQLFVFCSIGSGLDTRIKKFIITLYDIAWQEMNITDQKDLKLILTFAQNIKGIDAIFKPVNLETFQKV